MTITSRICKIRRDNPLILAVMHETTADLHSPGHEGFFARCPKFDK